MLRIAMCNEETVGDYLEALLARGNLSSSSSAYVLPRSVAQGCGEHSEHVLRATHVLLVLAAVEDLAFDSSGRFYDDSH